MTLYKFTNGTVANATEVNANVNKSLSLPILNKIRQQQDRSVDDSFNNDDIFSDAYIDANGRENTVNTGNTTALYNATVDTYSNDNATASGTTEELGAYTASPNKTTTMEYTCSADVDLYVKDVQFLTDNSGSGTLTVSLERNTGSGTYTTILSKSGTYGSGTSNFATTLSEYNGVYIPAGKNFKVACSISGNDMHYESGVAQPVVSGSVFDIDAGSAAGSASHRVIFGASGGITCESITTSASTTKVIEYTVPSGTFSATVSSLLGKALIYATETGATITHRLENGSENSGDIADGEIGEFTAFTSEPTKYIVKLTAASSGATPGYPSIKGSGVISE
jgi:hypothetical protein